MMVAPVVALSRLATSHPTLVRDRVFASDLALTSALTRNLALTGALARDLAPFVVARPRPENDLLRGRGLSGNRRGNGQAEPGDDEELLDG